MKTANPLEPLVYRLWKRSYYDSRAPKLRKAAHITRALIPHAVVARDCTFLVFHIDSNTCIK